MQQIALAILSFVLLSILGGRFANRLQHRSWLRQQQLTLKDKRVAELKTIFVELDAVLSKRIYRMRKLLYALRRLNVENVRAKLADYEAILYEWNDKRNSFQIRLVREVNVDLAQTFEHELSRDFVRIGSALEGLARFVVDGRAPDRFRFRLTENEVLLDSLSRSVYEFLRTIYIELQDAQQRVFDDESAADRDRQEAMTTWQLFRSLFLPDDPAVEQG